MIRSYFGLTQDPFALRDIELLSHQQEIHDTLRVHSQQGGLCLVVGRPGTGKSVIKESLRQLPDKDYLVVTGLASVVLPACFGSNCYRNG